MVDSELSKYIADKKIMVFSWTMCPYCVKAKNTLTKLGLKYETKELDKDPFTNKNTLQELDNLCGFETVPKIFIGKKCIGGCDDMHELIDNGNFDKILKEQGIL